MLGRLTDTVVPAFRGTLDRDRSVVFFDDSLGECEPNSGASRLRREKQLEDSWQHLRRDRRAAVRESASPAPVRERVGLQRDVGSLGRGIDGIRQDAPECLCELLAVNGNRRWRVAVSFAANCDRAALEASALRLEHVVPDRVGIGGRQLERDGSARARRSVPTIRLRRSTSRRMRPTFFSITGSSRARNRSSCAADEIPKIGLRSSCATPAATSPIASLRRRCPA